jgi:hypothetical protein
MTVICQFLFQPTCWKPWNLKLVLYYILYYWEIYGGNCWSESNKYLVVDLLLKPTERQCLVARTMPDGQFLDEGDLSHGKCIPIEIPQDDPLFSLFRQRCMQFARSAPACRTDGRLGHVEQVSWFYLEFFFCDWARCESDGRHQVIVLVHF